MVLNVLEVRRIYWLCLIFLLGGSVGVRAQFGQDSIPQNWHLLDYQKDGVYGISMERAYRELLVGMPGDTVIVAVIDTGIDTLHQDLKGVLWRNPGERGNDEDGNGYQGDFYGWNFLGNLENGFHDLEYKRMYALWHPRYKGKSPKEIRKRDRDEYSVWKEIEQKVMEDSLMNINGIRKILAQYEAEDRNIRKALGKELYTPDDLEKLDDEELKKRNFYRTLKYGKRYQSNEELLSETRERVKVIEAYCYYCAYAESALERRELRGADENDFQQRFYGNNNVMDPHGHGTHVAGIIGATRENGLGINGIADKVKIMTVRIVNTGDEYDKDVALAIRYAVNNGARVINMSFGKQYSPHYKEVKKAIRYALKKDVLLVNAAGNDGMNIDTVAFYPTSRSFSKKKNRFPNMITVGASGPTPEDLILNVSNYGPELVDVFAPGVGIYSTNRGGGYLQLSGTSMASPVVAGIAAVLRSYFPHLSARQVKQIIKASVTPIDFPVAPPIPWRKEVEEVKMKDLCKTGGIVNAYKAIQLAKEL